MEENEMYRRVRQLGIDDFVFPYEQPNQENEWVKLAKIVPWEVAEQEYAKRFINNGARHILRGLHWASAGTFGEDH